MKKKFGIATRIGIAFLFVCLALSNCGDDPGETAPPAPSAPAITVGDSQLMVSWTAVTGATAYEVWSGTTNSSAAATQFGNDVTVTNAVITGLTNNTTYYVWVKAKNSNGTSGFSPVASGKPTGTVTRIGEEDALAGKLLIWQVFGDAGRADQVSHNFIELYNNSGDNVDLNGYTLQYAAGNNNEEENSDFDWEVIDLSGYTIPKGASFLVLGSKNGEDSRFMIPDNSGDINNTMQISNRAFKVALINYTNKLTVQNPFNIDGNGAKAAGYVDMVASLNTQGTDVIHGFEGSLSMTFPRHSAQESIRRKSLTDTNDNSADFESVRYGQPSSGSVSIYENVKDVMIAFYGPKNTEHGEWNPIDVPNPEAPEAPTTVTPGNGKLTVMWDAVAFANSYEVWYGTADSSASATKLSNDAVGVSAEIEGLNNGTAYHIWIKAKARYSDYTSDFSPSTSGTPEAPALAFDYTPLVLNEVNGVEKWFEIYNTGTEEINLEDVKAYYGNNLTWTGLATQTIPANGYIQITQNQTNGAETGQFTTGLSANNANVTLQLRDPAGTVLDTYEKSTVVTNTMSFYDKAHARIPDGTGAWFYLDNSTGTPGATNGTSTTGVVKLGSVQNAYTPLILNEVNGASNEKWFEIYNTGDVEISLEGVTAHYSNSASVSFNVNNTWTGTAADTIPAKGYFATPRGNGDNLGTGLSANNANVRFQLRDPDGNVLDTYVKLIDINTGYDDIKNKSHARVPDGIGAWYYTADSTGTHGATNGTSTAGFVIFGDEN